MSARRKRFAMAFVERWAVIVLVATGCVDAGERSREIARVRSHLERALCELRAATPAGLDAAQAERRAVVIEDLRRYIEAEQYPENRVSPEMTPIFIDDRGARCAVAALLEASGHHALVERIARTRNLAYIEELGDDPELGAWLAEHGVTPSEAARIQPSYANTTASRWQPTFGIGGSALLGVATGTGAQVALAPALRVGARRVTESNSSCDRCVHSSLALIAEYSRGFIPGTGSTNQLALLLQYDLNDNAEDHQLYLIGGPMASVDEDDEPGAGLGGQAGFGFSLRSRPRPIFVEVIGASLAQGGGAVLRAGANLGVVW